MEKLQECMEELAEKFPQHEELTKYFLKKKDDIYEEEDDDEQSLVIQIVSVAKMLAFSTELLLAIGYDSVAIGLIYFNL